MLARLTWQPDDTPGPETLTVDLPPERIVEMRELIGTPEWATSELALWIPTRISAGAMEQRLYRAARITSIAPEEAPHV